MSIIYYHSEQIGNLLRCPTCKEDLEYINEDEQTLKGKGNYRNSTFGCIKCGTHINVQWVDGYSNPKMKVNLYEEDVRGYITALYKAELGVNKDVTDPTKQYYQTFIDKEVMDKFNVPYKNVSTQ